ncbi:MAG: M20/M25/M40 family metallo-hydrolase [Acidobacteriota bacterium]|nr:M20/M25/M40 family metallo-hydrolase [Acidobacteriota bacterium]
MRKYLLWVALFLVFIAVTLFRLTVWQQSAAASTQIPAEIKPALESITGDEILAHIKVLASDEYEGRAPGTKGETLTVNYLVEQFKRFGLKPGNPDGSYTQKVPLVGFTAEPSASLKVGGKSLDFNFPDDYVARSRRLLPEVTVENSGVVFVGYGIVAPEYGWDDFKNVDARGKTLIILDDEPQISDAREPSKLDEKMFKGKIATYYGTRSYKFEIAARKGAAAVLVVHNPATANASFKVIQNNFQREAFDIKLAATNRKPAPVEGWITLAAVQRLFAADNRHFDDLKQSALNKNFKPVLLRAAASFSGKIKWREIESHNVVAKIEGSDKYLKNEYVIYTAHWDHLGRDEKLKGDQIYNGAIDNAAGTAQMLEIAKGFAKLKKPPKRSILFIATTAEEKGFLGAKFYVANPLYPLKRTLANINLDAGNVWGRTKDVNNLGYGLTTLDDVLAETAKTQNRVFAREPFANGSYFFLSDQIEFARAGIAAVFPGSGNNYIGKSTDFGDKKWGDYGEKDYHQVSDEVKTDWDMSGAVEDAQWLLQIGYRVAQAEKFPEWKLDAEFKARRDKMLKQKKGRD